jgi:hypothetical protein
MSELAASREIRWLALDRAVRRRVLRSVRTGLPLSSPPDAALAVAYCAATLDWLSDRKRLRPLRLLVALVLVTELLVTWTMPVVPLLAALLGFGFLRLRAPALRRRLAAALKANADVASELEPPRVQLPGQSWLRRGRRRRWLVIALSAALAVTLYILIISSFFVPTSGRTSGSGVVNDQADRLSSAHGLARPN